MWIRSVSNGINRLARGRWPVAVLVALVLGGVALYFTQPRHPTLQLAPANQPDPLQGSEIREILPQDAIPAVDHPKFVAAGRAGMRDNLNVIGVELGGQAHAFPIPFLSRVEIVNDRLGETNIAITW